MASPLRNYRPTKNRCGFASRRIGAPTSLQRAAAKTMDLHTINLLTDRAEFIGDCLVWKLSKHANGYGRVRINGHENSAHRAMMEAVHGKIPSHLVVDHRCKNRGCINPIHLRLVTKEQNVLENSIGSAAVNKNKTSCIHGHLFSPENTLITKGRNGRTERICKTCHRQRAKKHYYQTHTE